MFALNAAWTFLFQASLDPMNLPIGPAGSVSPLVGLTKTTSGAAATMDDLVRAASGKRFVFVGESHDNAAHHQFQADVIRALAASGRPVIIGFEQFTRPNQADLGMLTSRRWTVDEFAEQSAWKRDWNMDFKLYRPIFEAAYDLKLPMVALNVPRDWVRTISRTGLASLPAEQAGQVPSIDLTNAEHRSIFDAMMGGHPASPDGAARMNNTYASMVFWDTAMADSALRAMRWRGENAVCVIIAGVGHNLYNRGIGMRIGVQTGGKEKVLTVISVQGGDPVARGIGDFVFRPKE